MVVQEIIRVKIVHIEKALTRLKDKKRKLTKQELIASLDLQDIVIRNLQLAIQGCVDIASHIVSDEGWPIPGSLVGLFDILGQHGVISADLRERMKSMVGFRNIIVHEYEDIDLSKVYKIIAGNLRDFDKFLQAICKFAKL